MRGRDVDLDTVGVTLETNTVGPLRLIQAFAPTSITAAPDIEPQLVDGAGQISSSSYLDQRGHSLALLEQLDRALEAARRQAAAENAAQAKTMVRFPETSTRRSPRLRGSA